MKTSSAKAKGRRFQQWVMENVSKITGFKCGKDELIRSREMGQSGTDVCILGPAKEFFPFSIECKCQETFSIPAWIKQTKENQQKETDWLLFCTKNRFDKIVVMDAEVFFDLYEQYLNYVFGENRLIKFVEKSD